MIKKLYRTLFGFCIITSNERFGWRRRLLMAPVLAKLFEQILKMSAKKEIKVSDLKKLKSLYAMELKSKISNLQRP